MKEAQRFKIVKRVLTEGHPYGSIGRVEGNAESGPSTVSYLGWRWGAVHLILSPSGSVWMQVGKLKRDPAFVGLNQYPWQGWLRDILLRQKV